MRPRSRWIRWARWAGLAIVLLSLALALGRDLPRRWLESQLAKALGGEVHLAHFEWPDNGVVVLEGFRLQGSTLSPALGRVLIERIEAHASWSELLKGEVNHLELVGFAAEVDPTRPLLAPGPTRPLPFKTIAWSGFTCICLVTGDDTRQLAEFHFQARFKNSPGFPGRFRGKLLGLDLADAEAMLPLELPVAARQQLEGLEFGDLELAGTSRGNGQFALTLRGRPFAEAVLHLEGGRLDAKVTGIDLAALSVAGAPVSAEGQGEIEVYGTLDEADLQLRLGASTWRFGGSTTRLGDTELLATYHRAAEAEPAGYTVDVTRLTIELLASDLPALPPAASTLLPARLDWQGRLFPARRAAEGQGTLQVPALGSFPFSGQLAVEGLDLQLETPRLELARLLDLLPEETAEIGRAGFVQAKARLTGPLDAMAASGELSFEGLAPLPELENLAGRTRWRWSAERPPLLRFEGLEGQTLARLPVVDLAPLEINFRGSGSADVGRRSFEVKKFELHTAELGAVAGQAQAALPATASIGLSALVGKARLEISGIEVPTYLRIFGPNPQPAGLAFAGRLMATVDVDKKADLPFEATGNWRLAAAGFASPAGDRVLEGLAFDGQIHARLDAEGVEGADYHLRAEGRSSGFQILWGTLFGDFSTASLQLAAEAEGRLGGPGPKLAIRLDPGPGVQLQGDLDAAGAYHLKVLAEDLEAVRRDWLLPLFAQLAPLRLAGRLELETRGDLPLSGRALSARGRLQIQQGELQKDGIEAEGLFLDFPFDLEQSGETFVGPRLSGRLGASRLAFAGFEVPPLQSRLHIEADTVRLEEAMAIPFAGGQVRLERVLASRLLAATPRLETAITLEGLSLAELAAGAGFLPLEGRLDGQLPRVVVEGEKLEVDGGGRIALFGGEVEIGDISGSDVFSPYPRLRLSARFRDLDLGQITQRFDFGEMQGIVEGEIENCVIFRNVPLSFRARVQSVPRKGVKQSVDVKAVQNLTILGTGASTSVLDRGVQRFFKRYYYSRLGITAELGNDVLLLRGLEERGGKELFLRGRPPFSIDIVNAQPGKTVSFLAMVRRLRSLDTSKAQTGR